METVINRKADIAQKDTTTEKQHVCLFGNVYCTRGARTQYAVTLTKVAFAKSGNSLISCIALVVVTCSHTVSVMIADLLRSIYHRINVV